LIGLYNGVDATLRAEQTTATIAVIQLGTLLAGLSIFARDIINITTAFVRDHHCVAKRQASCKRQAVQPVA